MYYGVSSSYFFELPFGVKLPQFAIALVEAFGKYPAATQHVAMVTTRAAFQICRGAGQEREFKSCA
jgi:hypothetical protein